MTKFEELTWVSDPSSGERMNQDQERAVKIIGILIKYFEFYSQSIIQRLIEVSSWKEPV